MPAGSGGTRATSKRQGRPRARCAGDVDGARARVDPEVAAAELARQEPTRPGDPAAQVEDGDAAADCRPLGERPDLPRAHETLLLDVLAGLVGRLMGSPQRLDERTTLVLPHGLVDKPMHDSDRTFPWMFERGATLRMFERGARWRSDAEGGSRPAARARRPLLLLAVLARTVGLGGAGWLVGPAVGLMLNAALARALWRDPVARLGPADWVTLIRATLAVGVAALTAASFERDLAVATLVALASVALALDFVDGWVARRTGTTSALGARLDGEVDAFLILVLSVEVAPSIGGWVLAIGLARYAFFAAGWALPWLRAPLPRRDWRKTVTASQGSRW